MGTEPKHIWKSYRLTYDGATKYYKVRGSEVYHADKYCHLISESKVVMYESHSISTHAEPCGMCTVQDPEYKNIVEKVEYR